MSQKDPDYNSEPVKTDDEFVPFWLDKIHATERALKKYWDQWDSDYERYAGKHWKNEPDAPPSSNNPRLKCTVNLTGSRIADQIAYLFYNEVTWKMSAKPKGEMLALENLVIKSRQAQALMNQFWSDGDMDDQCILCLMDAAICGTGVKFTGYNLDYDKTHTPAKQGEIVPPDFVKEDAPWVECISPYLFLPDLDARQKNLATSRWCGLIYYVSYHDLVTNDRYIKSVQDKIGSGEVSLTYGKSYLDGCDREDEMKGSKMVKCYRVFDRQHDNYFEFADRCEDYLFHQSYKERYGHLDGFPLEILTLSPLRNQWFGMSDVKFLEDLQDQINFERTFEIQHARRMASRKYMYREGAFDDTQMSILMNGDDGASVGTKDIQNALAIVQDLPISGDLYTLGNIIKNDMNELLGDKVQPLPSRASATEAQIQSAQVGAKINAKRKRVKKFIKRVGRQVWQHTQFFLSSEKAVLVSGGQWVKLNPEDIKGEYDLDLEPLEKPESDAQTESRNALQVLQITVPSIPVIQQALQAEGKTLRLAKMFEWVFSKLGATDIGEWFSVAMPQLMQPVGQTAPPPAPTNGSAVSQNAVNPVSELQGAGLNQ